MDVLVRLLPLHVGRQSCIILLSTVLFAQRFPGHDFYLYPLLCYIVEAVLLPCCMNARLLACILSFEDPQCVSNQP